MSPQLDPRMRIHVPAVFIGNELGEPFKQFGPTTGGVVIATYWKKNEYPRLSVRFHSLCEEEIGPGCKVSLRIIEPSLNLLSDDAVGKITYVSSAECEEVIRREATNQPRSTEYIFTWKKDDETDETGSILGADGNVDHIATKIFRAEMEKYAQS